jgi:alpha,alpha-trehalase
MQELNHAGLDQVIDVHAPAKTYYTTGSNAGNAINRLRKLSVSLLYNTYI